MSSRKILNLYTSQIASDTIWDKISEHFDDTYTVEPPNRGHFGTVAFVLSSEVVLFSEVV